MSIPDSSATAFSVHQDLALRLRSGDRDLDQLLGDAENDPILGRMHVSELLEALPVVGGTVAVSQMMTEVGIAPTRRVRALTAAQHSALLQRCSDPGAVG